MSIRRCRAIMVVMMMGAWCATGWSLDAQRELTQALHRIWQVPQGLPDPTIFCVRQFADGYLWLGTQSGLDRFDGVRFSRIDRRGTDSLGSPWVKDIARAADGTLWLATTEGVVEVRPNGVTRYPLAMLGGRAPEQLGFDGHGVLWVRAGGQVARRQTGLWEVVPLPKGLAVGAMAVSEKGVRIAGVEGAVVWIAQGESFSEVRRLQGVPPVEGVSALLATGAGSLWVGTTAGVVHVEGEKVSVITKGDGLPDDQVLSLAAAREGSGGVWVGTRSGFSRVRGSEVDTYRPEDGLSQSTVYSLMEDREGSLWVGTKHGLNQFLDGRTIPFTTAEGLPSNDAGPVIEDGAGTTWVGTLGSGLSRFDGKKFTKVAENLGSGTIYALAGEKAGSGLWVGTDRGVMAFGGEGGWQRFGKGEGLPSEGVKCLYRDRRGILWAGTTAGLAALRGNRFEVVAGETLGSQEILALGETGAGALLAATAKGELYRVEGTGAEALSAKEPRLEDVDSFYRDGDGRVWMGTAGKGLRMMDGAGKVTALGVGEGLFDDEIFGVVEDQEGRIWMACGKGIFSVAREELLRFAKGEVGRVTSSPFSPTDAQRTIECRPGVQPGAWRMEDGRLWFSTIHGMTVIDPRHVARANGPAPAVIEEVLVNGQAEVPMEVGTLGPGLKNLEFRYTGLSFMAPVREGFRYRLEGFDKEWVDAGSRREAFYTNLSPGNYRFRVAAKNVEGAWTEAGEGLTFTLAAHFYQRWWFWVACAVAAVGAAWMGYRLRVRAIQGRMLAIVRERSRIARELHDTLLQGFSGVTMEMQALAGRLSESGERAALTGIIADAAECMKEARRSVAGLRQGERVTLAMAIEQAAKQLTEAREVRLKLELAEKTPMLPVDVEYNLVKIAQEAIANAVKHSGGRVIEVVLKGEGAGVTLRVRDDGRGFDPAAEGVGGHYGLVGMQERAGVIGGVLRVETMVGKGTVVSVGVGFSP